ncbi:LysE/ArgO family amino acid transporter [Sporolactobacillus vineae]|uniref:LysE/ArgO family amino acid transporter n=1 Tax=Sporolactobacillus vineae TaxID=444463 RepID=UPI000288D39E|nr:LysE family transporter [Sporolactobacillus vineae]
MVLVAIVHGFLLALSLILPLGAQNIFIFIQGVHSRTLISTLPAIVTAALSDTFLIVIAVEGVSLVILHAPFLKNVFLLAGSAFLVVIGSRIWMSASRIGNDHVPLLPAGKRILYAASVSLLNPHAILDTVGVIGTNALNYTGWAKWAFALACALVSWIWFFSLAFAGKLLGQMPFLNKSLFVVNKLSAIMIWLIAGYLIATLIFSLM